MPPTPSPHTLARCRSVFRWPRSAGSCPIRARAGHLKVRFGRSELYRETASGAVAPAWAAGVSPISDRGAEHDREPDAHELSAMSRSLAITAIVGVASTSSPCSKYIPELAAFLTYQQVKLHRGAFCKTVGAVMGVCPATVTKLGLCPSLRVIGSADNRIISLIRTPITRGRLVACSTGLRGAEQRVLAGLGSPGGAGRGVSLP
jgi:hypothetical protein